MNDVHKEQPIDNLKPYRAKYEAKGGADGKEVGCKHGVAKYGNHCVALYITNYSLWTHLERVKIQPLSYAVESHKPRNITNGGSYPQPLFGRIRMLDEGIDCKDASKAKECG